MKILIVGAGLSGATLAERFASDGHEVTVVEKRSHIGGNTHDYIDENGIRIGTYGAHITHSHSKRFWDYMSKFTTFNTYKHRVKSMVNGKLVPVPVNIDTVNILFDENIKTEKEMTNWLERRQYKGKVENSEDAALARVGDELYKLMFRGYTKKQWDLYPEELEPSVLERIPVRTDFYDRYFSDRYEGLPNEGYTNMVENMLSHELITIKLNTDYFEQKDNLGSFDMTFFTGPIDRYFNNKLGKLQYRSLRFENEVIDRESFQELPVINYPGLDTDFTRIVEHKLFYGLGDKNKTVITKEFSSWEGEEYYPVPTPRNRELYAKYQKLAEKLEKDGTYFVGRLASYKYVNMDQAVLNALELYDKVAKNKSPHANSGKRHTKESKKKMSKSLKGRTPWNKGTKNQYSEDYKRKIGEASKRINTGRTDDKSTRWKGEDVSYSGLHHWVRKKLGKASKCEKQDKTCAGEFQWANISHQYKRDLSDYMQLCISHHVRYDNKKGIK